MIESGGGCERGVATNASRLTLLHLSAEDRRDGDELKAGLAFTEVLRRVWPHGLPQGHMR